MRDRTPWMVATVFVAAQAAGSSQPRVAAPAATDVTKADFEKTLERAPAAGVMDQQIRVVDIGKYNVAVGGLHRAGRQSIRRSRMRK